MEVDSPLRNPSPTPRVPDDGPGVAGNTPHSRGSTPSSSALTHSHPPAASTSPNGVSPLSTPQLSNGTVTARSSIASGEGRQSTTLERAQHEQTPPQLSQQPATATPPAATASASSPNGAMDIDDDHLPSPTVAGTQEHDEAEHDGTSSSGASNYPPSAASGSVNGVGSATSCSAVDAVHVAGPDESPDDMDRFLKRMEMEKKIAQLQQRLELASFKTNHGWTDMSIGEIENRLPSPTTARRPQLVIPSPGGRGPGQYEPPSPSRPWQLADVLWQPLPQPGTMQPSPGGNSRKRSSAHGPSSSLPGGLPSLNVMTGGASSSRLAPESPQRRRRMDEFLSGPKLSPMRGPPAWSGRGGSNSLQSSGHRRSSSSISGIQTFLTKDPYPASPLRPKKPKKRSQSHSNLRERPSTQDVDAAKALTFMLGSARSPVMNNGERDRDRERERERNPMTDAPGPLLPPIAHTSSLPPPFSPDMPPPRPRAQSFAMPDQRRPSPQRETRVAYHHTLGPPDLGTPSSHSRGRGTSIDSSAAFRNAYGEAWQRGPQGMNGTPPGYVRDSPSRRSAADSDEGMAGRGEEDKNAAELMMFLAHSPSPARKRPSEGSTPSFSGAARVLFADGDHPPPSSMRRGTHSRSSSLSGALGPPPLAAAPSHSSHAHRPSLPPNGLPPPPLSARALREAPLGARS